MAKRKKRKLSPVGSEMWEADQASKVMGIEPHSHREKNAARAAAYDRVDRKRAKKTPGGHIGTTNAGGRTVPELARAAAAVKRRRARIAAQKAAKAKSR